MSENGNGTSKAAKVKPKPRCPYCGVSGRFVTNDDWEEPMFKSDSPWGFSCRFCGAARQRSGVGEYRRHGVAVLL